MGTGAGLRPSLGLLGTEVGRSGGLGNGKGSPRVALGAWKRHPRAPEGTRSSRKAPRSRLKLLRAPCRKEPRCLPHAAGDVWVRFRRGSAGLWRFRVTVN